MSSSEQVRANVRRLLAENLAKGKSPANQNELADKMKVGRQAISKMLKAKGALNLSSVDAIAAALGVTAHSLVTEPGAEHPCLEDLERDPTAREMARFVRWAKRTPGADQFLEELLLTDTAAGTAKRKRD